MKVIEELSIYLKNRPVELRRMKDKGVKIVGCSAGGFVPEEIIYACGAVPVCLVRGGEPEPVAASAPYIPRFICPFVRAQIGYRAMEEEPYYQMTDIFISAITCQHIRRMTDYYDLYTDLEVFRFGVPHEWDSEHGFKYYLGMLNLMREKLEKLTGNELTKEKIREAISLYNKMRELLKKISLLRKAQPPPISGRDFIKLNHDSFLADKVFMVDVLDSLYAELRQKEGEAVNLNQPRILLVGPNLAIGDYKVVDLIEESGGVIVAEEICEGMRHYWENVDETNGDLMEALAQRYLSRRVPCAYMRPAIGKRLEFIMDIIRQFNVQGVVWYQLLFCETYNIEAFIVAQKLKEIGVPMLKVESEYNVAERGQLKTRIETFLETIRGR